MSELPRESMIPMLSVMGANGVLRVHISLPPIELAAWMTQTFNKYGAPGRLVLYRVSDAEDRRKQAVLKTIRIHHVPGQCLTGVELFTTPAFLRDGLFDIRLDYNPSISQDAATKTIPIIVNAQTGNVFVKEFARYLIPFNGDYRSADHGKQTDFADDDYKAVTSDFGASIKQDCQHILVADYLTPALLLVIVVTTLLLALILWRVCKALGSVSSNPETIQLL
jgi:hypothetical protein